MINNNYYYFVIDSNSGFKDKTLYMYTLCGSNTKIGCTIEDVKSKIDEFNLNLTIDKYNL